MSSQKKKWIFRNSSGHIYGPFEITKVQELIEKSVLSGEEEAAEYPAGDWSNFSSNTELSEILLQSLSQPTLKTSHKSSPKIEIPIPDPSPSPSKRGVVQKKELKKTFVPPADIELKEEKKLKQGTNIIPIIILLVAALMMTWVWQKKTFKKIPSISLIKPQIKSKGSEAKAVEYIKQGWAYFYKDTYLNYSKAQEYFVRAVEESPSNTEALVMLLMTDFELWPFAKQDSLDQSTIQWVLQQTTKSDLYGPKRVLASAIGEMITGQEINAKSQVDSALISQPSEGRFYSLKGQLFFNSSEFEQAKNYFDKASSLIPYWIKPIYMAGNCLARSGQPAVAQNYFLKALQMNPSHMASRLELGILEVNYFNHIDKAKEFLIVALSSQEKLQPLLEARGRFTLAVIYQKSGEIEKARSEAEKAFALNPADPAFQELVAKLGGNGNRVPRAAGGDKQSMQLGEQYMRMKNYLAAQAQFKAALELNGNNAVAALKAGEALWKLHQANDSMIYLQKALQIDPKLVAAAVKLSDFKTQRFDFDGAARALEQAIKGNPKDHEVYKAYGLFYFRRGNYDSAETFTKRALSMYETDVGSNLLLSKVLIGKKEIIKAVQYAKRAIDLDSKNIEAQINYAKVKVSFEGVKNAQEYIKELINTYPSELEYRMALAEILAQDEQFTSAKSVLEQILAFDSNHKEAYLLLGDVSFLNQKPEEALGNYFSASRIDPSDPSGLFRAGDIYFKLGKLGDAQKQFQLVLKINPLFPRAHYNLAKVFFKSGFGDLAIKELDEEKKTNPRLADPYEFSGDIYLFLKKYSLAAQQYQKASELRPSGADIYVKQAKAYRGQGSFDGALAMLRLAKAKESGFSEIYKEQGYIFEQKGQAQEAVLSFKQYLRLEPNPPDKSMILDKIKELE